MKYRKLPVIIEAVQFTYPPTDELLVFAAGALGKITKARTPNAKAEAEIKTLEDGEYIRVVHVATEGDFIVKGVKAEFYAVKEPIFWETYEEVKDNV